MHWAEVSHWCWRRCRWLEVAVWTFGNFSPISKSFRHDSYGAGLRMFPPRISLCGGTRAFWSKHFRFPSRWRNSKSRWSSAVRRSYLCSLPALYGAIAFGFIWVRFRSRCLMFVGGRCWWALLGVGNIFFPTGSIFMCTPDRTGNIFACGSALLIFVSRGFPRAFPANRCQPVFS